MAGPYVIGVDGGTEGLRAGVFDLTGAPLAFAAAALALSSITVVLNSFRLNRSRPSR